VLKGSREGVLTRIQPVSIHGQLSYDVHYTLTEDEQETTHVARLGAEALSPQLTAGDRVRIDYLIGVVTAVERIV
jgi:hypothetical protein